MPETLIILTPGFPENEYDSTCMPDRQLFVAALKKANPALRILVITFQYPFERRTYVWMGVEVIAIGGGNNGKLGRALTWLKVWRELGRLHRLHTITGVLSFWLGECALIGDRFAKKFKLKHFCWLLGQDAKPGNKYVARIKPAANQLIALSDFIAAEFARNYGIIPHHRIPGAIDPNMFGPKAPCRDIDVMGCGSLIPLKQFSVFIDIISGLKEQCPDIKAVICGKGPELQLLRDKIATAGLRKNIILPGELPHNEVLALMQRSKVFLHTSNYEGFGMVCLEALYAGAKVVSFVKPMNQAIENWHIAASADEAAAHIAQVLINKDATFTPTLPYKLCDSVDSLLKLFGQQVEAKAPILPAMALNES